MAFHHAGKITRGVVMGAKQRPFLAAAIMPPVTPALFRIHRRQNAQAAMPSGPDCDGAGEGMLECQAGVNEGEFVQMIRPDVTRYPGNFLDFLAGSGV